MRKDVVGGWGEEKKRGGCENEKSSVLSLIY